MTAIEERVLDFVKSSEISPTLRQIADYMRWSSIATAADVVNRLIRRGMLARRRKSKTLRAIEPKPA